MENQDVWSIFEGLPSSAKKEAADFIRFLQNRYKRNDAEQSNISPLVDEPFVGLWQERKEFQDSSSWVRNLRNREWRG